MAGNGIDSLAVLPESQGAVGLIVAGNLLESVTGALHSEHKVHLQGVLGSDELSLVDWLSEAVKLISANLEQVSGVGARSSNLDTEEAGVREVRVDSTDCVDKTVVSDDSVGTAGVTSTEGVGLTNQFIHNLEGRNVVVGPWDGLECNLDASLGRLGPGSVLATDVLRRLSSVVVLGDSQNITKALLDELDVLGVVLDTTGDDKALLGSDVVHDELLENTGVQVVDVAAHTETGHTERVIAECSPEQKLVIIG